jgi:hypothetical protein
VGEREGSRHGQYGRRNGRGGVGRDRFVEKEGTEKDGGQRVGHLERGEGQGEVSALGQGGVRGGCPG